MPRDSNNVYTLPEAPFQPNTVAQPAPVNNNFSDIATALTDSLTRAETTPFTRGLLDDADAATARTTLGATVTGGALFTAADATAARGTLGAAALGANTFTGDQTISKASPFAVLNKTGSGQTNRIEGQLNGTPQILIDLGSETTGDFRIGRFNDAGTFQDFPLFIDRATGNPSVSQPAAWRSAIGAPPLPQAGAGVGQFRLIATGNGEAAVLPAGGSWAFSIIQFNSSSGIYAFNSAANVAAGGTTVGSAASGFVWVGFAWRIA